MTTGSASVRIGTSQITVTLCSDGGRRQLRVELREPYQPVVRFDPLRLPILIPPGRDPLVINGAGDGVYQEPQAEPPAAGTGPRRDLLDRLISNTCGTDVVALLRLQASYDTGVQDRVASIAATANRAFTIARSTARGGTPAAFVVVRDCRGAGPYLLTPHQARHYHLAVRGGENPRAPLCPTAIGRRVQTEDEVLAWSYGFGLQQAPEFVSRP